MKKVKIMLLSLLVLAVAGGAMAFKAKLTNPFCTTATVNNACPAAPIDCIFVKAKLDASGSPVCTTRTINNTCNNVTDCTVLTKTIGD